MGRGRHAGYDDQREAILAEAARLFATRGYAATSMNEVADACGLSKATLYHYHRDKDALLFSIADSHMQRLDAVVQEAATLTGDPESRLRQLVRRLVEEYAGAQDQHWVLTSEVRFLPAEQRHRILERERAVVAAFAKVVADLRPDLDETTLAKPLTLLLFGMVNWMFTWMKPGGKLDHDAMGPIVADLFLGGLPAVKPPAQGASARLRENAVPAPPPALIPSLSTRLGEGVRPHKESS